MVRADISLPQLCQVASTRISLMHVYIRIGCRTGSCEDDGDEARLR